MSFKVSKNPERGVVVQQCRPYFWNLRENCKFVDFNRPTSVYRQVSARKAFQYLQTMIAYCQKLNSWTYI